MLLAEEFGLMRVTEMGLANTGDKGPNTHWAHCEHIESIGNM